MFSNIPDWMPFACLITGKLTNRKPMVTRLAESLLLGIISGALSLYVGVKILENDMVNDRRRLDDHIKWADNQVAARDGEMARARLENIRDADNIISRLQRIEDCIRTRTCTK